MTEQTAQTNIKRNSIRYSVIIPVYNEVESLTELHSELMDVLTALDAEYELIFVDDGSTDGSLQKLFYFVEQNDRVRVISFAKNYGKAAVYMAGFQACNGEIIITLDADLQDIPKEIPKLLNALNNGSDLVIGWKQGRLKNEPLKSVPSSIYNLLKKVLFNLKLHDSNCGFRVMRRQVALNLRLYGDRYRFIPELAHLCGFSVCEVLVEHRPRKRGKSKYGPSRFLTGFLDLFSVRFLSTYSLKPLHFFGSIAILPILIGFGLELYVLALKVQGSTFKTHVAAIITGTVFILIGFQFIGIGLIGEMLSSQHKGQHYEIKTIRGFDSNHV